MTGAERRVEDDVGAGANIASVLLHPFVKCVSCLNFGYAVHPTEPIHLRNSEFIEVCDGRLIRILHLQPAAEASGMRASSAIEKRHSVRNSLTEEYWFTRWNKPLQAGHPGNRCSCSYRRSQRYSALPEEAPTRVSESAPTKIKNLETFVERLLQETLLEAYQETIVMTAQRSQLTPTNSKTENAQKTLEPATERAYDNLAYEEDQLDAVVKRRDKVRRVETNKDLNCRHNKPKIQKPFVFLLHGIGSTAEVWWNVIDSLLAKDYEIAAPDMLGHGYSSAPNQRSAYKFKKLLEHALAAFDHYALKDESRKFIVIGHSFGCSLATAIARYRSTQVVQLVLISGGGPTALSPPEIGNEISVFSHLQVLISPLLFCGMKRSLFYASRGKHFQRCDADESIPKYVLDYIDREQHWPEGDAAFHRRILIPTLLVHGLQDTNVTLVQQCEMERTIPRAFLELIPTAGHMSLLETPEQLTHMILCFVEWWAR